MSNLNTSKGKHHTIEHHILIEYRLDQCYSLKEIAEKVSKNPTTISTEIKINQIIKSTNKKEKDVFRCASRKNCTKTNLCNKNCRKPCNNVS